MKQQLKLEWQQFKKFKKNLAAATEGLQAALKKETQESLKCLLEYLTLFLTTNYSLWIAVKEINRSILLETQIRLCTASESKITSFESPHTDLFHGGRGGSCPKKTSCFRPYYGQNDPSSSSD